MKEEKTTQLLVDEMEVEKCYIDRKYLMKRN